MDKNSKLVVRHVRDDKRKGSLQRAFPKLSGLFRPTPREAAGVVQRINSIKNHPRFNRMERKQRRALMETLHANTLSILDKHDIRTYENLIAIPDEVLDHCLKEGSFVILNDLAAYLEDYGPHWGHTYGGFEPIMSLLGIHAGPFSTLDKQVRLKHYSEANEEQRKGQRAVIQATRTINIEHLHFSDENEGLIHRRVNAALTLFLLENHEDAERIIRIINTRHINPNKRGLEDIKAILLSENEIGKTLSGGAL